MDILLGSYLNSKVENANNAASDFSSRINNTVSDISSSINDFLSKIPCNKSEQNDLLKYIPLLISQVKELSITLKSQNLCITNFEALKKFLTDNPGLKIPTEESINNDIKTLKSCLEANTYVQSNLKTTGTLLQILKPAIPQQESNSAQKAIDYQTQSILVDISNNIVNATTYMEKAKYQMQMYSSVKYINQILLILYCIIFIVIHFLFLVQYLQGVKRDEIADSVWLTVFFLYPYLIHYIEMTLYSMITYMLAFVYGQAYVYEFDKLFMFTDFYSDPYISNPTISP